MGINVGREKGGLKKKRMKTRKNKLTETAGESTVSLLVVVKNSGILILCKKSSGCTCQ